MALTYSSAIRNEIAQLVWAVQSGTDDLNSRQLALLDGDNTSTPTGQAGMALSLIQQYAQHFAQTSPDTAPDAWRHWLVAETAYYCATVEYPDRTGEFRRRADRAMEHAVSSFSAADITGTSVAGGTFNPLAIRKYVMDYAIRRYDSRGRRLFPSPDVIDAELIWSMNRVYNATGWHFRKRQVLMTVESDGTVTMSLPAGETFDSIASLNLYHTTPYTSTSSPAYWYGWWPDGVVRWADGDVMARLLARESSTTITLSTATWTASTRTLTQTGAFANYTFVTGDTLVITGGTGATAGSYEIASKVSDDAVTLTGSIAAGNLATGDIAGTGGVIVERGYPRAFRVEQNANKWLWYPAPSQRYPMRAEVFTAGPSTFANASDTSVLGELPAEFQPVVRDLALARVLRFMGEQDGLSMLREATDEMERMLAIYEDKGNADTDLGVRDVYCDQAYMDHGPFELGGAM